MIARLLTGVVLLVAAHARADTPRAILDRASAAFSEALAEQDPALARERFLESAAELERLVREHSVRNADLHANLANAYSLAGDPAHAILHYRRALHLDPSQRQAALGLRAARARVGASIDPAAARSIADRLLSLRSLIPSAWIVWAFACSYSGAWLATAYLAIAPRAGRPAASMALRASLPVALAASVLLLSNHALDAASRDAVVMVETHAMNGPGAGIYSPSFDQPLAPGIEVTLLERRGSWWRARLRDARETWIESSALERVALPTRAGGPSTPAA